MWLLSKNRVVDAMKSLQWLRGWVQPIAVQKEFNKLCKFSKSIQTCNDCQQSGIECKHLKITYASNVKAITKPYIQKPFILCFMMEIFLQFSLLLAIRPYVIQIFMSFGIQLDASLVAVYMSVISCVACLCLTAVIKFTGKRMMYLGSILACVLLTYALGM